MEFEINNIILALLMYLVATASPGPAILSIMDIAVNKGRKSALIFSSGVLLGSFIWAILALFGVASILSTYASLLYWFKVMAGFYLLFLSFSVFKKMYLNKKLIENNNNRKSTDSNNELFAKGLALHITNPKAIFTWLAIVSLALPNATSIALSLIVVLLCMILGAIVFFGYALLFSTLKAQKIYEKFSNLINSFLGMIFGLSGLKLILSNKD